MAYFSKKLIPTEWNYYVGDHKLLSIKLALEEWQYWLEGATYLFIIITDYKNLEYLCSVKRLNFRQARWSLFFTQIFFHCILLTWV